MSAPNPIEATVEKMILERKSFFWDACTYLQVSFIAGDYVEFGSWGGNSLSLAYDAIRQWGTPRHLWAFDSFQGLPTPTHPRDARWAGDSTGQGGVDAFLEACDEQGVPREAYTAIEGYFEDTLPPLGADAAPNDIALAYIDCNMYRSTLDVFEFLVPRLKHGMVLAFDDYFCSSPTDVSGERAAMLELEAAHPEWSFVRFKDIHWSGVSFIVESSSALPQVSTPGQDT